MLLAGLRTHGAVPSPDHLRETVWCPFWAIIFRRSSKSQP